MGRKFYGQVYGADCLIVSTSLTFLDHLYLTIEEEKLTKNVIV